MNDKAKLMFEQLKADGYSLFISKKEYAEIIGCSVSAVDNYIKQGYGIPDFKKIGDAKNARVLFNLIDVVNYLSATQKG